MKACVGHLTNPHKKRPKPSEKTMKIRRRKSDVFFMDFGLILGGFGEHFGDQKCIKKRVQFSMEKTTWPICFLDVGGCRMLLETTRTYAALRGYVPGTEDICCLLARCSWPLLFVHLAIGFLFIYALTALHLHGSR